MRTDRGLQLICERVSQPVRLARISDQNIDEALTLVERVFPQYSGWVKQYISQLMNPSMSVVAYIGDEMMGFYFLGNRTIFEGLADQGDSMQPTEDLSQYKTKKGVEGIALGTRSDIRGKGVGAKLKDYSSSLGCDYIWGLQLKSLNNIDKWLHRRRIVAEDSEMYATLQDIK